MKTILVVGSGRQSEALIRFLSSTGSYHILVLTRNTSSEGALDLAKLPEVELVASGAQTGYDIEVFFETAKRADSVFVNVDGFAVGEAADTFWGIRLIETSIRAGVKHVIYSGLESIGSMTNYDPHFYVGHYQGKARVQQWMHGLPSDLKTKWTIIRTGPYIDQLDSILAATLNNATDPPTIEFRLPLGPSPGGGIPFIHLPDVARYVHWALENPSESASLDFGVSTVHASGEDIAAAATAVTGKPARYVPIEFGEWVRVFDRYPSGPDSKIGWASVGPASQDKLVGAMTFRQNFEHWWNLYKASGENKGLIRKDYALLDRILPDRMKSVEEWMRWADYTGPEARAKPAVPS
jgi:nucleoside-diphosphate-sugar epimerase